jgi:hypothetical protein
MEVRMAEDPLKFRRDTPPETPEDHGHIWLAVERINAAWPLLAPLVAVRKNRYAIVAAFGLAGWLNWDRILQVLSALTSGGA